MFSGFAEFDVTTADGSIHGRRGGYGPPLLLLHGIPETHLMWHRVAHALAERFTVVATDLRGFGNSTSPPAQADHSPNSMRAIAAEQVEVMSSLGFDGVTAAWYEPLAIWREWADDVSGAALDCGHFLPEEAPEETAAHLLAFFDH